jgi:adenosylhomocysteine nucleosidase
MAERGDSGGMNIGAINTGPGSMTVGTAIGQQNNHSRATPESAAGPRVPADRRADIGVIAVLSVEMRAVVHTLQRTGSYRTRQLHGGAQAHEAEFALHGARLRTVAMQALDPGPRSAVIAYHQLQKHYAPPIVLLVGVAGAIEAGIAIGDVVISDEVIYYDARREAADGVLRRGQGHRMAPVLRHRLNEFFRVHGEVLSDREGVPFRVHRGPVGSGDAVVTDRRSDIRQWLRRFNEKTLAVETEAGGVAQAFYEELAADTSHRGWLTIRGISDRADRHMGQEYHELAATHAADVLERLLPFLVLTGAAHVGS